MIRAIVTIGVLQFLSMLLMLVKTKVLAVTLGPAAVGTMSVIDKLTALVTQTLSLSLPFAAVRFLPAALRESPESMDLLYRRMRAVLVTLIVPAAIVCVAIAIVAPERWGVELVPHQRALTLAFAGLPVVALVPFLTNAFAGGMSHARSMTFAIAHSAVLVVAAIVGGFGGGIAGFYGVYAALGTVLVVVAARRVTAPAAQAHVRIPLRELFRLPPAVWRFAGALFAITFAGPYAAVFVQYTALRLYGAAASGILQSAIGVSLSVRALVGTAHAVLLTPHVNRQGDAGERMAWANEFQRNTVLFFLMGLPPLLLFPDIALRALYSGRFVEAAPYVSLFIAAEVLGLLSGTYQTLIIAGDRMLFHVIQNFIAQALLVGVAAIALPRLGLAGAGLAALSAPVFLFFSTLVFLKRQFRIHASREAALMALLTATILLGCGIIGSRYVGVSAALLGVKAAACVGVWCAAYLLMPEEDRSRLRSGLVRGRKELRARLAPPPAS